ncbi:hypothetical protein ACG83_30425 [Frankia sp. R43]|nr:hypothetical protein ACG83_30425 [Frankia sp. R43]
MALAGGLVQAVLLAGRRFVDGPARLDRHNIRYGRAQPEVELAWPGREWLVRDHLQIQGGGSDHR